MIMMEATARKLDFGLMNETRRMPNLTGLRNDYASLKAEVDRSQRANQLNLRVGYCYSAAVGVIETV